MGVYDNYLTIYEREWEYNLRRKSGRGSLSAEHSAKRYHTTFAQASTRPETAHQDAAATLTKTSVLVVQSSRLVSF